MSKRLRAELELLGAGGWVQRCAEGRERGVRRGGGRDGGRWGGGRRDRGFLSSDTCCRYGERAQEDSRKNLYSVHLGVYMSSETVAGIGNR